ncbi:MAG: globin [Trebouxia sp. A1-2]|nr:MAG: globin [Trebouxia sp. A1-2]
MTYAFGGPEEYHGKDMWRAHEKLVRDQGLNDNHFNIIVKHLVGALQKFNVPEEDIQAAGKVVETTRDPMFRDPITKEYLG